MAKDEKPKAIYGELAITLAAPILTAEASVRRGLSVQCLLAAKKAALIVHRVEVDNASAVEFGPWADDMLNAVPTAVVMSAAALEAAVNEAVKDLLDNPVKHGLTAAQVAELRSEFDSRFGNPRSRAEKVAEIIGRPAATSLQEWRDLKLLIWMRNRLIHFKPRWDHEAIPDEAVFTELLTRIGPPNRFFAAPKPEMPHGAFTYGCSRWAVQTVTAFIRVYAPHLGVIDRFAGNDFSLP
ncbi:hypothetical protein KPL78_13865 [Roseomonas sp. HJA6]|uniref:Uncharacterized protein n=1 Tax=Roseomonas alba TaxID=2846776 RepID=A0ABS7A9J6_9PROT|nr:hypothetical protein [Neoroseomonas alba]MBW6398946.1 hypothetical protein [Neoroseomonas alba]